MLVLGCLLLFVVGCNDDSTEPDVPAPPTGVMPDFSLLDVNPDSPSHAQQVSPRYHLESVSAYYFGTKTWTAS